MLKQCRATLKNMLFRYKLIVFLALFSYNQISQGQPEKTIIRGIDPSFAGKTITITTEKDFITETIDTLAAGSADQKGGFSFTINLSEITKVFITFGKYKGVLYAEPGRNYDLVLPKYAEMTIADSLNPYYEPEIFFLKIKNPVIPELNDAIANFESIFNTFISEKFYDVYVYRYYTKIDTLKPFFDSLFNDVTHPFFNNYKDYSIAYLLTITLKNSHKTTIKDFFYNKPILYNNPAYTSLFSELFKNYIPYYAETNEGKRILTDIVRSKSYRYAMETLERNPLLEPLALRELVLIKGIYDLLVEETAPASSCYQLLDSIKILTPIERHRKIVDEIKAQTLYFAPGTKAPDFTLTDINNNKVSLSQFKGKLTYITFININGFTASADLETLNILHQKHKNQLNIITIAVGHGTWEQFRNHFIEKNYQWTLLNGTEAHELQKQYRVRATPFCYLLDTNLRLKLSPAPGPNEYFEIYLLRILREQRIQRLRQQNEPTQKN